MYEELSSRVSQWINEDCSEQAYKTLIEDIEEAYDSGEISPTDYDHLTNLLEDYQ